VPAAVRSEAVSRARSRGAPVDHAVHRRRITIAVPDSASFRATQGSRPVLSGRRSPYYHRTFGALM